MNKELRLLDELYENSMWMTDSDREMLRRKIEDGSLSYTAMIEIINSGENYIKTNWKKVFNGIGDKKEYYSCPRKIFPVGENDVFILKTKYRFQRLIGKFRVYIYPYFAYELKKGSKYKCITLDLEAANNTLSVPVSFKKEDLYILNFYLVLDNEELFFLSAQIYALEKDLFGKTFLKADLHMHTTESDGYEPPELVVTAAKKRGMDVIAVTDHNNYNGSVLAKRAAEEAQLDLTVITGEEYALEYSPMHILALGTEKAIDRSYLRGNNALSAEDLMDYPESSQVDIDQEIYIRTQKLLKEITRLGGVSILAHPFWKPIERRGFRIDTPESFFIELFKRRQFDGIEIISGSSNGECHKGNLQFLFAQQALENFVGVPVIGISDSHHYSTDEIIGKHFTVIFADGKGDKEVLNAIKAGYTVAVEKVGDSALCYGQYRFCKIAHFLVQCYFPDRDARAYIQGIHAEERLKNND